MTASALVEPLGEPSVTPRGDRLVIRYRFAVFEPGEHAVAMPPVELVHVDGTAETVLGDTALVRVASVLPAGDSVPSPKPSLGPVPRAVRKPGPLIVLISLVLGSAGLWAVRRRRVGTRPASDTLDAAQPRPADPEPPLARWVGAGEVRAAASVAAEWLRRALEQAEPRARVSLSTEECLAVLRDARPEWPLDDLADALHALERARFAPAVSSDVLALVDQTRILIARTK